MSAWGFLIISHLPSKTTPSAILSLAVRMLPNTLPVESISSFSVASTLPFTVPPITTQPTLMLAVIVAPFST